MPCPAIPTACTLTAAPDGLYLVVFLSPAQTTRGYAFELGKPVDFCGWFRPGAESVFKPQARIAGLYRNFTSGDWLAVFEESAPYPLPTGWRLEIRSGFGAVVPFAVRPQIGKHWPCHIHFCLNTVVFQTSSVNALRRSQPKPSS